MKKFCYILIYLLFSINFVFSENYSGTALSANKNTALRCLKLAENCLIGKDWDNAVKQAELGLSYDDSISDLIYIKAAAQINLDKTKSEIIKLVRLAFEKDNWTAQNKNGARILLADLLCDTGLYEESMSILDSEPLIFSSDAEFIRIKNLYRMGTQDSVNNARLRLNTARRVYPSDSRFPNLFFMFEYMFLSKAEVSGTEYETPEIVSTIANFYITKLPDYKDDNDQLELYAAFFAQGEEKLRLTKAIEAKHKENHPLLSLLALKTGIYTDQTAMESFFASCDSAISLNLLESLVYNLNDDSVKYAVMEKLLNFNGSVFIDENSDLQEEIEVYYESGRPLYIKYDSNNDGINEIYASCDFGLPLMCYFENRHCQVFYDQYPGVSKISFSENNCDLTFLHDEFYFSPFELKSDSVLLSLGLDFYVPSFSKEFDIPQMSDLLLTSNSIALSVEERENAFVKFKTLDGKPVFADFYQNENRYAYCDFSVDLPLVRYVDCDGDGAFETSEFYNVTEDDSLYDKNAIQNIFSNLIGKKRLYLEKLLIDRNSNNFYEFSESYMENGGKVSLWDNDDNGIWDLQYIRYPAKEGQPQIEENIFFDQGGLPFVTVNIMDGVPVKMLYKDNEVMIYAGSGENFYWLEEEGQKEWENYIFDCIKEGINQGAVKVLQFNDVRFSVIKVGKNYYCKVLPPSDLTVTEENDGDSD